MKRVRNIAFVGICVFWLFQHTAVTEAFSCSITSGLGTTQVTGVCSNGCHEAVALCSDYCYYTLPQQYLPGYFCWPESLFCTDDPEGGPVPFECNCMCW